MKRCRGFKLGRRLARVWRWAVCSSRRRYAKQQYLRLDSAADSASKSNLSAASMMTTKLFSWGRHLARRLRRGAAPYGRNLPLLERPEEPPPPKGHLAVYVGGEMEGGPPRRYLVPVIYFNHPLFGELLREAEEEFGFHHPGGITIPCPAAKFEHVRTRIAACGQRLHRRGAASVLS
ncbi:auxin-responsive protein SAUR36-like [Canna indica]|uniref:Auxin-responsive protein SAUR36-like n=1 Tax=Canna indica TaxID=4628 RepID=A0AAQ3QBY1_9LILI|nr:auxin-responsive protein SAUR36-like [Canna indica]